MCVGTGLLAGILRYRYIHVLLEMSFIYIYICIKLYKYICIEMSFKEVVFDTKDMSLEEQLYTR